MRLGVAAAVIAGGLVAGDVEIEDGVITRAGIRSCDPGGRSAPRNERAVGGFNRTECRMAEDSGIGGNAISDRGTAGQP